MKVVEHYLVEGHIKIKIAYIDVIEMFRDLNSQVCEKQSYELHEIYGLL